MATPSESAKTKHEHFYVTRESQNVRVHKSDSAELSYVGMRNLSDLERIDEQDIVSARGTIRGRKNRVRAGLANFENPKALEKLNTERGKVVVYVTSFRSVRATFEECRYVLDLFHNLRVRVETKDIYVYRSYHRELEERLRQSGHVSVPQVFIGGQHVGGKAELEELNEVGELRKILEEYPRYETGNNCKVCGGFEFIPCRKCGGSKNSRANQFTLEFRALRCTHCNEDGMEGCPECEERRREREEELMKKATLETDDRRGGNKSGGDGGGDIVGGDDKAEDIDGDVGLKDKREVASEDELEAVYQINPDPEQEAHTAEEEADVTPELVIDQCAEDTVLAEAEEKREGREEEIVGDVETEESDREEDNTAVALTKFICDLDIVQF